MNNAAFFRPGMPGTVTVTTPGGQAVIAHWYQSAPAYPWSDVGVSQRLSQQPNPSVQVRDEDAAGLVERDTLTIRETAYLIVRMDPDGSGLTRIELMPAAAGSDDESARWR